MYKLWIFLLLISYATVDAQHAPIELGIVNWHRDLNQAKKLATQTSKPILLFFQEVPGCSTCRNFGSEVMSNELIAEYIESNFIPLLVYNNKAGDDAHTLKTYQEPAWNNPVLRVVKADGKDLVARHANQYTPGQVMAFLNRAVLASGQLVPEYAQLLESEYNTEPSTLTLQMYCFWTGERILGKVNGVIKTEAGYNHGQEVVKLEYDEKLISTASLLEIAKKSGNADLVYTTNASQKDASKKWNIKNVEDKNEFRLDKEAHYYLYHSPYAKLKLTDMQATKVNAAIGNGEDPKRFLSPKQLNCL